MTAETPHSGVPLASYISRSTSTATLWTPTHVRYGSTHTSRRFGSIWEVYMRVATTRFLTPSTPMLAQLSSTPATQLSHSALSCSNKRKLRAVLFPQPRVLKTFTLRRMRILWCRRLVCLVHPCSCSLGPTRARPQFSAQTRGDPPISCCPCPHSLMGTVAHPPARTEVGPRHLLCSTIATYPLIHHWRRWTSIVRRCTHASRMVHIPLARMAVDHQHKVCCCTTLFLSNSLCRTLCAAHLAILMNRPKVTIVCHLLHPLLLTPCARTRRLPMSDLRTMDARRWGLVNLERQDALLRLIHMHATTLCPSASRGGSAACRPSRLSGNASRGVAVRAPSTSPIHSQCTRVDTRRRVPRVLEANLALRLCRPLCRTNVSTGTRVLESRLVPLSLDPDRRRQWCTATSMCGGMTRDSMPAMVRRGSTTVDVNQSGKWSTRGKCALRAVSPRRSRCAPYAECSRPALSVTGALQKVRVCLLSRCQRCLSLRIVDVAIRRTRTLRARTAVSLLQATYRRRSVNGVHQRRNV